MLPIGVRQTTGRAIIVLHTTGCSPPVVQVSSARDSIQVDYHHQVDDRSLLSVVTWTIRPLSRQDSEEGGLPTIQDCTLSISAENMVLTIAKFENTEWQALHLTFKSCPVKNGEATLGGPHVQTESAVVRFATPMNAMHLLYAARAGTPWESGSYVQGQQPHVSHVQARKVPSVNAIEVTAELAPGACGAETRPVEPSNDKTQR